MYIVHIIYFYINGHLYETHLLKLIHSNNLSTLSIYFSSSSYFFLYQANINLMILEILY